MHGSHILQVKRAVQNSIQRTIRTAHVPNTSLSQGLLTSLSCKTHHLLWPSGNGGGCSLVQNTPNQRCEAPAKLQLRQASEAARQAISTSQILKEATRLHHHRESNWPFKIELQMRTGKQQRIHPARSALPPGTGRPAKCTAGALQAAKHFRNVNAATTRKLV